MNLLIVDDDDNDRALVAHAVKKLDASHNFVEATNLSEARTLLQNNKFDAVLLDIALANESGIAFMREIRNNKTLKHQKVYFLSGSPSGVTWERAQNLKADGFFTKPSNPRRMVKILEKIIKACTVPS